MPWPLEVPITRQRGSLSRVGVAHRAATARRAALDRETGGCSQDRGHARAARHRDRPSEARTNQADRREALGPEAPQRTAAVGSSASTPGTLHSLEELEGANHRQASRRRITLSRIRLSRYRSVETRGPYSPCVTASASEREAGSEPAGGCNPSNGPPPVTSRAAGSVLPAKQILASGTDIPSERHTAILSSLLAGLQRVMDAGTERILKCAPVRAPIAAGAGREELAAVGFIHRWVGVSCGVSQAEEFSTSTHHLTSSRSLSHDLTSAFHPIAERLPALREVNRPAHRGTGRCSAPRVNGLRRGRWAVDCAPFRDLAPLSDGWLRAWRGPHQPGRGLCALTRIPRASHTPGTRLRRHTRYGAGPRAALTPPGPQSRPWAPSPRPGAQPEDDHRPHGRHQRRPVWRTRRTCPRRRTTYRSGRRPRRSDDLPAGLPRSVR